MQIIKECFIIYFININIFMSNVIKIANKKLLYKIKKIEHSLPEVVMGNGSMVGSVTKQRLGSR